MLRCTLLAILLIAAPWARAARPFVTDDARLVDSGGCQVETFVKKQRRFDEQEFWFLPACNPWGPVELTLGGAWVDAAGAGESRTLLAQGKMLLRPLATNGYGIALALGAGRVRPFTGRATVNPYANLIGSRSFAGDRVVLHANLGAVRDRQVQLTRGTWGVGAEILLHAPGWYAIAETYGQRIEKPTLHAGIRYWVLPNRLQVDATAGRQHAAPADRSFVSVGLRLLW